MVQEIGNRQARCIYEAGLPDNFRRPQTDSYPCPLVCLFALNLAAEHSGSWFPVSILMGIFPGKPGLAGFIEAKDDGGAGDNWSCKSCKAPVESSPPTK